MSAEPDLLPCPFGYVEPRHDLSGYEVCDDPGPRRAAIWNLAGIEEAMRRATAARDAEVEALRAEVERWKSLHATAYDAFRTGVATERRLEARAERLAAALRGLLNDTQHKDHDCGDERWCPVIAARAALEQEEGRASA